MVGGLVKKIKSSKEINKNPLFSVIIPSFNRSNFIVEAIESVIMQTYPNWEICIVDDGSTDNTYEKIKHLLANKKIKYQYQENQGQSVARNNGIKLAKGKYICFLDSDNAWLNDRLEIALSSIIENPESDIIYGDSITIDIEGNEIARKKIKKYSGKITKELLKDNFVSMNAALAKKECFDKLGMFNEEDRLAEDYELWLRFSTKYTFLHVPKFMAKYRVMDDQLSTDKEKRFWANEQIIIKFRKSHPNALSSSEWRRGFSFFYLRKSNYERQQGHFLFSFSDALKSLVYDAFWQGPWRSLIKTILLIKR